VYPFAGNGRSWRKADTRQTRHQYEQVDEFRCSDGAFITSLRRRKGHRRSGHKFADKIPCLLD
jgi:hypothetical protein